VRTSVNRRTLVALVLCAGLAGGCSASVGQSAAIPKAPASGPLVAPRASYAQDTDYFQDLAKVDPSLTSYVESKQGVALQALLTDGAAFCAFLKRGGGVDDAMESVVIGANSVESRTHLPESVTTFNALDAVALVDLCPGEQALLPSADRAHIESLSKSLSEPSSERFSAGRSSLSSAPTR
jgi:hypothetical protein